MGRITWNPGTFNTQEIRASVGGPIVKGKLRAKGVICQAHPRRVRRQPLPESGGLEQATPLPTGFALEWLPTDNLSIRGDFDRTEDDAEPVGLTRLAVKPFLLCVSWKGCASVRQSLRYRERNRPGQRCRDHGLLTDTDLGHQRRAAVQIHHRDTGNRYPELDRLRHQRRRRSPTPRRRTSMIRRPRSSSSSTMVAGSWSGVVGFYYFDGQPAAVSRPSSIRISRTPPVVMSKTKSYAVYADAAIKLTDRLSFEPRHCGRPGRRSTAGHSTSINIRPDDFTAYYFVAADFDEEVTFTSWAPKIGLDYQFNQDVMGYFKVNRGFKSGGYNVRAQSTSSRDTRVTVR